MERLARKKEIEPAFCRTNVVVVGGGLSGLALHRELDSRNIDHIVLEASPAHKSPSIHFLTSKASAESLGIEHLFDGAGRSRTLITGYVRYDGTKPGLEPLELIKPDKSRAGFVTLSLAELREALGGSTKILNATPAVGFEQQYDGVEVTVRGGKKIRTKVVVDATGARAKIYRKMTGSESPFERRIVRDCYGGVYPYNGPEDTLLFVDKFPNSDGLPPESAGWVMPLGDGMAEVVVGHETTLDKAGKWHQASLKHLIDDYISWFNERGIHINANERLEVISGTFSQGLVDFTSLPQLPGVALFGESLGLNHPLNGYLIRGIAHHARIMADEISKYLDSGSWHPHQNLVQQSKINYGSQVVLSERKQIASQNGDGRTEATLPVYQLLVDALGKEGLWEAIDNNVQFERILSGLLSNPNSKHFSTLLRLGIGYLKLLLKEDVYREELRLKLKRHKNKETSKLK